MQIPSKVPDSCLPSNHPDWHTHRVLFPNNPSPSNSTTEHIAILLDTKSQTTPSLNSTNSKQKKAPTLFVLPHLRHQSNFQTRAAYATTHSGQLHTMLHHDFRTVYPRPLQPRLRQSCVHTVSSTPSALPKCCGKQANSLDTTLDLPCPLQQSFPRRPKKERRCGRRSTRSVRTREAPTSCPS